MPLGGSGFLTEAVLGKANEKLEQAIEDLRIKYEKKAQVEAEAAAAKAKEKAAEVEGKKSTEPEMSMEDPELEALRQSRIAALKSATSSKKAFRVAGHGELREIVEDDFLKDVTASEFVCVHFFHPEFETCKVMDKHLRIIAAKPAAMQTRFLRIEAPKATFFVAKLHVKVLPTLIFFHNGIATGRLVGFEGLKTLAPAGLSAVSASASASTIVAGTDFTTPSLYRLLKMSGVMGPKAEEAADSDSEEDYGEGGGGGGGGGGSVSMAEARRRMLAKLESSGDAGDD